MDAAADLEQRRAALAGAVSQARREVRRAKAAAKARSRAWQLSTTQQRSALIVYAATGYAVGPAVKYLNGVGRRRGWPAVAEERLRAVVEELFLDADADVLAALADEASPSDAEAMREAAPVLEEWRLATWARAQNEERGVAPSTAQLLDRLAADRLRAGHPDAYARGTTAVPASRKWACRFRRRWGGRFGTLPVSEGVPLAEMREKARDTMRLYACPSWSAGWDGHPVGIVTTHT